MHTNVLLSWTRPKGPIPTPLPFHGGRESFLDLTPEELSKFLSNNRGFLQRRRRRSDDILEKLFPNASSDLFPGGKVNDPELIGKVNKAMWEAGYIIAGEVYGGVGRELFGEIYRWEYAPNWGHR